LPIGPDWTQSQPGKKETAHLTHRGSIYPLIDEPTYQRLSDATSRLIDDAIDKPILVLITKPTDV
jgi:hypothetical protein